MRILPLSDLHLELWKEFAPKIDIAISRPDVIILAGDIHTGAKAVEWAHQTFADVPVLYIHGNHEAYGKNLEDVQVEIAEACKATGHVHFLNEGELVVDGVRFLGATMWTDFDLFGTDTRQAAMRAAEAVIMDYKRIRLTNVSDQKLRAADTAKMHATQKHWLQTKLAEKFSGKTVVVTHMAPSTLSVAERYANDIVSAAFASNLDDLVKQADMWVHGHMHNSFDYQLEKCRVVCNPCGYMTRGGGVENGSFDPNLVVEI
ncbi:metallophosphoesterase [Undibacterium sp. 14-3-2]|uniref:metallophosphoesterase n=1 Tax=Undibacterium sp. 14-3-2 TaxID=2800129 RepID=UPI001904168F|nr:metallophosphoesterase [Undibacterium sp. 14-3-2]MBK1888682.1 metallophosphoesterase [Undibacterium sp. 14-3-2]